jgi:hypothetical protein
MDGPSPCTKCGGFDYGPENMNSSCFCQVDPHDSRLKGPTNPPMDTNDDEPPSGDESVDGARTDGPCEKCGGFDYGPENDETSCFCDVNPNDPRLRGPDEMIHSSNGINPSEAPRNHGTCDIL